MADQDAPRDEDGFEPRPRLGWGTVVGVLVLYAAALAGATYPVVLTFGSKLPASLGDPLQHLWVMRWYKACLAEGRSPFLCPDLEYPLGSPLGNFSPMHLQSLLYLPLSAVCPNDILCYNLLWAGGLLFTAMGTFLLAWHALGHRGCAALAGLMTVFSMPMMLHALGHLELIYLGGFPVFLVAWMRLIDRPGWGRLIGAAAAYVVVAMSAAYYLVLAIFPAALYAAWSASRGGGRGWWPWVKGRAPWLAGFAALVVPCLAALFAAHLWAALHGHSPVQSRDEFDKYGAPLWGYVVPTFGFHLAGALFLPCDLYAAAGFGGTEGERGSYLGVVVLVLLAYAALRRVRFERSSYWWSALALMAVLGLGSTWRVGDRRIELPAGWVWDAFFAFRLIRVPARFNLFVAVVAPVVACAALRDLLGRVALPRRRAALVVGAMALVVIDGRIPFRPVDVPSLPACFAALKALDPSATILEVPVTSGGSNLSWGYWQSQHRMATSAFLSGHPNRRFFQRVTLVSPFSHMRIQHPAYLGEGGPASFDDISRAEFEGYAWLFLTVNDLKYVVLHLDGFPGESVGAPLVRDRIRWRLDHAKVFEDDRAVAFARSKLRPPAAPAVLCTDGWRPSSRDGRVIRAIGREAGLAVYNPPPGAPVVLAIEARAFKAARVVRVLAEGVELARWEVGPGGFERYETPPMSLPEGVEHLTISCDGEEPPTRRRQRANEWDEDPYSLWVSGLEVRPAEGEARFARAGARAL